MDALSIAAEYASGRAPAPDEWDVVSTPAATFLRARWVAPERHHLTLRIMQVDGRWVAMPSGTLDRSTLILLTHATTWVGVVLEQMGAHGERVRQLDEDGAREAAEARAFNEETNHAPSV